MTTFNDAPHRTAKNKRKSKAGVLGVPYDFGSTTRTTGQAAAPRGIRLSYVGPSVKGLVDLGDIEVAARSIDDVTAILEAEVHHILKYEVDRLIVLGGDDSIAYGVLKGMDKPQLVHFDAHADREVGELDHSSWVYRAEEDSLVGAVAQWGTRAPGDVTNGYTLRSQTPTCVVVDMDVFDPSAAPGVAVPEPFGPMSEQVRDQLRTVYRTCDVRVLVITEVVPALDHNEQTQRLAFRLAYDFATI